MENETKELVVPALSLPKPPQNDPKGGREILSSEFRKRFIATVPTCPPLKDNICTEKEESVRSGYNGRNIAYSETLSEKGGQGDRGTEPETPLDKVLDIKFEKWLDQKKTLRRDFKMNGARFKDCVVYVLCSLNIEPTFGNFRKWDPVLDWEAICLQDLRNKGIIE
jgi:hypothetical protein